MSLLADQMAQKRLHGQFFTTTNPFNVDPFHKWLKGVPAYRGLEFLEPFAGANNIVCMLQDLGYANAWSCFDIEPADKDENASSFPVKKRDTLQDYPRGFKVAITNPPYLAKNSATRRGLPFPATDYDDLYKVAVALMLEHTPYVAAIIPESFITQGLFHSRLQCVISLPCRMFEDTEVPVCLALFVPEERKQAKSDFEIYSENRLVGRYSELCAHLVAPKGTLIAWKFNESSGLIGLRAVDSQTGPSIQFVRGELIDEADVKPTSRSITRIAADISPAQAQKVIEVANKLLAERREKTKDTFMTAFKGLRHDGRYRRRLDFAQARDLLNLAAQQTGVVK